MAPLITEQSCLRCHKKQGYQVGDIVTGGATVILAMGAGRTAAAAIHEKLMGKKG